MTVPVPTITETYEKCCYRYLVGLYGDAADLQRRLSHTIAVLGGSEPEPIDADILLEMVESVCAGRAILVMSDRADLRDAAKTEIMQAISVAMTPVAGSA